MNEHWTETEVEALKTADTFEEVAEIAITILSRMSKAGLEIVQICGPMSTGGLGNLADNMARFQLAIERAFANGLLVFDQLPFQEVIIRLSGFQEGRSNYNWDILEIFYKRIFESGYVRRTLFIPGWGGSTGASWERQMVTKLGLIVEEYPIEWLK